MSVASIYTRPPRRSSALTYEPQVAMCTGLGQATGLNAYWRVCQCHKLRPEKKKKGSGRMTSIASLLLHGTSSGPYDLYWVWMTKYSIWSCRMVPVSASVKKPAEIQANIVTHSDGMFSPLSSTERIGVSESHILQRTSKQSVILLVAYAKPNLQLYCNC